MRERYRFRVRYYETDRMGIVHHSNYIRWFEEARMDYVRRAGIDYADIEKQGVLMVVTGVDCEYRSPLRYGDTVEIETRLSSWNGVRCAFSYRVFRQGEEGPAAAGNSRHGFLDERTRLPVNIRKKLPDLSALFGRLASEDGGNT